MNFDLMPSQARLLDNILEELEFPTVSRQNYILTGAEGVGKTFLGKYLAKKVCGEYISFTREYGMEFLEDIDLLDIDGSDLLQFLKSMLDGARDKLFVIDDLEFVFNYLLLNRKVDKFLRSFKRQYFFNKVILIIHSKYLIELFDEIDENVFQLIFRKDDKIYLADKYYAPKSLVSEYKNGYFF